MKYRTVATAITIYAIARILLCFLYGGYSALNWAPIIILNIAFFIFIYLVFIAGYLLIKKCLRNRMILVFAAICLANVIAYFTMEDFHKIFRIAPFKFSLVEQSIWESLQSTYFEGFNYIAWMPSILCLLYQDLKKDSLS